MALVRSSFVVAAPADRVFGFVADPRNFKTMWPAMTDVFDLRPSSAGGQNWRWAYRMLGFRLEGTTVVREFDPPRRIVMHSAGSGLTVAHTWALQSVDEGTHLDLDMNFILPAQWLTSVAEPLLVRENRQQVAIAMNNLRQAVEQQPRDAYDNSADITVRLPARSARSRWLSRSGPKG